MEKLRGFGFICFLVSFVSFFSLLFFTPFLHIHIIMNLIMRLGRTKNIKGGDVDLTGGHGSR